VNHLKFNTDYNQVHKIIDRLEITGGYCPCIPPNEYNKDTECPCKDSKEKKECHCGLLIKKEVEI
jgi:ferredoxin-thioredoxin reductase catalytic subunit